MYWTTNRFACTKVEQIWVSMLPFEVPGVDVVDAIHPINRNEAISFALNAILHYVKSVLSHFIVQRFCDNKRIENVLYI